MEPHVPAGADLGARPAHPDLIDALDERGVQPGRALDVGCGTGDNAIELARRGFDVTAIDVAERAPDMARSKAAAAEVSVDFRLCDITARSTDLDGPLAFIVDRGAADVTVR